MLLNILFYKLKNNTVSYLLKKILALKKSARYLIKYVFVDFHLITLTQFIISLDNEILLSKNFVTQNI